MSERAKEVAEQCAKIANNTCYLGTAIGAYLCALPEFQEPKWIPCAERMPEERQNVFFYGDGFHRIAEGSFRCGVFYEISSYQSVTHWMPRYVPKPPDPEESPLVKELVELRMAVLRRNGLVENDASQELFRAIGVVKRHEAQKAKS